MFEPVELIAHILSGAGLEPTQAEDEGIEPPTLLQATVFKTA